MSSPDVSLFASDAAAASPAHPNGKRSVSIVIPVHNKATITRQCLDALLTEPADSIERELIVVDDGSSDGTPVLLAGYNEHIKVVRNDSALGFAGACNAGVAAARHDLLVLLNNDTIPTGGWLSALVSHAEANPRAAVVGAKLLFPNETIQHAGVVFGLDYEPHHIYSGFPADHPVTATSRRFQAVTAACALFRRQPWEALGGLDTSYRNGWEDIDYCMRLGEAGYEVHYCAESVVYHFESATRDLFSAAERDNRALFAQRWRDKVVPDDFGYYWMDGLFQAHYGARYPIKVSISPLLGGLKVGDADRLADRILYDRARQVMILLRNNIVLNVRVQEAEARAAEAERRLAEALAQLGATATVQPATDSSLDLESGTDPIDDSSDESAGAESPPPALPHRIVGMVESPGRVPDVITDGVLVVSGWTLTESGSARIEAVVNGEPRGTIAYGEPRPDAAALYPGFPAGANAGFSGEIPVGDLPDGFHNVTIRISATDVDHAELTTTFEVANQAFEKGRIIGRIDQPIRGALYIPRELAFVSGWVMAPSGIRSLAVLVDGEPRGRVDHGALRPDIGKRRRQYPNADHCGFSGSVPMRGLGPGSHELTVRATANDAQQLEMSTRIETDSTPTIDGGVPILNRHYRTWLEKQTARLQVPTHEHVSPTHGLTFEAIVPLEGDVADTLEALSASLLAQTKRAWRATLIDSGDASEETRELARRLVESDDRFVIQGAAGQSFAAAANCRLTQSDADWVTVLQPGVLLAPRAFDAITTALAGMPQARLAYTDDDRVDPGTAERWNPFFKPDWSPDLLLAMNYLGPLTLFQRQAALEAGGLREDFPGAEVFDLALRLSEQPHRVCHVPEILVTTIEAAPTEDEPWHVSNWNPSERLAIVDALARRGEDGCVENGLHPGTWRVKYALADPPGVTALIPTGGKLQLLRPCLEDLLERTDYPNLEILLVDNSPDDGVAKLVAEFSERYPNIRRVTDDRRPFNYSALINGAVPLITTPFILMLNDDITVIDPDWLRAMVEHAQRPQVGIVGAKLIYPDDSIQHAGVVLGPFGGSIHVFKRLSAANPGYFDLPNVVRNYSAVTFACALIDRALFAEIGGLDEENLPVAFNDTDFCLRAREAGYEVIYTPHAALYHHESVTKTVIAHPHEIGFLRDRWGHVIAHDPYYNPNLTRQGEDARLNMEITSVA
jgi:GT2 family glycosyltransferase